MNDVTDALSFDLIPREISGGNALSSVPNRWIEGAAHDNGVYPVDAEFESREFWVLRKFVSPRVHQVIGCTQLQQA